MAPSATVKTNGLRSYLMLGDKGYRHERIIAARSNPSEELRWLHVIVSNVKALIGGTYHGLGRGDGSISKHTWTNTPTVSTAVTCSIRFSTAA